MTGRSFFLIGEEQSFSETRKAPDDDDGLDRVALEVYTGLLRQQRASISIRINATMFTFNYSKSLH